MKNNYRLGNFICKLREDAGMDQKTLAVLLGVSSSAISQCENGGGIKIEKLFQLSELFGVTLDELLSGKKAEQSIAERLEDLYYIDEDELPRAISRGDYEKIAELLQRMESVRGRFEELVYRRIFAKITSDEDIELGYLKRYYNENIFASKYFTNIILFIDDGEKYNYAKETLTNAIHDDRNAFAWELNKIFSLKLDFHLQEILELLERDDRIETEQSRLKCFAALFGALPSLLKDVLFSEITYSEVSFNIKIPLVKVMIERGVNLLYLPTIKNMTHVDGEVRSALEGELERDKKLTEVVTLYQNNCVNGFEGKDFIRLIYEDYQACINEDGMRELVKLVNLRGSNRIAYWDAFKTTKLYRKQSWGV